MRTLEVIYPNTTQSSISRHGVVDSTIGQEIQRRAGLQPDHAAMVSLGFAPLSYRELQCLIGEARAALRLAGFGRSARIAIAMPTSLVGRLRWQSLRWPVPLCAFPSIRDSLVVKSSHPWALFAQTPSS
jgi:non-ribosomal peptide synthetase component E (peptide arylation enzyme)